MTKQLIILVGISGAGKSTFSNKLIEKDNNFLKINRDDIRTSLVGNLKNYYIREDFQTLEGIINHLQVAIASKVVSANKSIVIDNTHLSKDYINKWINLFTYDNFFNHRGYSIKFKLFDCDLNVAKNRVIRRDLYEEYEDQLTLNNDVDLSNSPEVNYINKQFQQYYSIKQWLNENYKELIYAEGE